MVASTDGYCTLVQFSSSELGVPLPPEKQKVKVTQKGDVEPEETPKSKKNPNKGKNANKDAAKEEEKVSSNLLWELYPKKSALVMRGECVELSIKCVSIGSGQEHSVCARVLCVCVCVCACTDNPIDEASRVGDQDAFQQNVTNDCRVHV